MNLEAGRLEVGHLSVCESLEIRRPEFPPKLRLRVLGCSGVRVYPTYLPYLPYRPHLPYLFIYPTYPTV